jgi:hypothetical protein
VTAFVLAMAAQEFSGAMQPQVAVGSGGAAYVAMIRDGNIVVAASDDGGKTFGEPVVAIDAAGEARGGMRRGPRIGVDGKGGLVVTAPVCFDKAELRNRYPASELWLVRSSDKGKTWTKPVRVNEVPKKAAEALHWMAVDDSGTAHVAWLDVREKNANCLWYARVAGEKPERNRRITDPVCECCAPGMALDGKGNPVIVVREGQKQDRGILMTISSNKGQSFGKPGIVSDVKSNVDG